MPDPTDRAQEAAADYTRFSIEAARSRGSQSTLADCQDCGDPIPEARRKAVPGCTRCLDCQETYEQRRGR
ncbi:transcriptional regulator, TraR/DksA family [Desulfatibacillum aliphaticivorans]|uniref:Transcriptional regulator, TraR/DksA family n=1 Tax=Desulfatibacillum aliphaticivorans TaxID=218208 RepID=B8FC44_DESAL|nr:TraR/DksA C4-type zinc finger protein [Desulfatibacillum aliphaticivorans]ACL05249.1 transcriptional regulator, TraR/DksA family [Desulfatibacillum aliphaticivorans]